MSPVDEFLIRCKADAPPFRPKPLVPWDKGDTALKAFFEEQREHHDRYMTETPYRLGLQITLPPVYRRPFARRSNDTTGMRPWGPTNWDEEWRTFLWNTDLMRLADGMGPYWRDPVRKALPDDATPQQQAAWDDETKRLAEQQRNAAEIALKDNQETYERLQKRQRQEWEEKETERVERSKTLFSAGSNHLPSGSHAPLKRALAEMNPEDVRLFNGYLATAFACYEDHIKALERDCMRLGKTVHAGSEERRKELDTRAHELGKETRRFEQEKGKIEQQLRETEDILRDTRTLLSPLMRQKCEVPVNLGVFGHIELERRLEAGLVANRAEVESYITKVRVGSVPDMHLMPRERKQWGDGKGARYVVDWKKPEEPPRYDLKGIDNPKQVVGGILKLEYDGSFTQEQIHARLEPYAERADAHFVADGVFIQQRPGFARAPATIAKDFTIDGLKPKVLKAQTGKGGGTMDRAWEQITKLA